MNNLYFMIISSLEIFIVKILNNSLSFFLKATFFLIGAGPSVRNGYLYSLI